MTFADMLCVYLAGYGLLKFISERKYFKDKEKEYQEETRIARMLGILEE